MEKDINMAPGYVYAIHPQYHNHVATRLQRLSRLTADKQAAAIEAAIKSEAKYEIRDGIAIIRMKGIMEKIAYWSDEVSTIYIQRQLQSAGTNDKVHAVLLVVNSPGGTVEGIADLEDALAAVRAAKPLVVQSDGMIASAAYWAAAQGNKIYAGRGDMIGSIGVRQILYDESKWFEKEGIEPVVIDTGEHKSAGAMGTKITDEQREEFQRIVDVYYDMFLKAILRGRTISMKALQPLADGRVFIGQEAVDNGLIDGVLTFDETLAKIKKKRASRTSGAIRDRRIRQLKLKA